MLPNFGAQKIEVLQNADRWPDLINLLNFNAVLRMFFASENPHPRMALKNHSKPA